MSKFFDSQINSIVLDQLVCNDDKLSRLGQLRRGLSMYIPVGSELNQKIVLKRKDGSNLDNWNEENLYDKVSILTLIFLY